MQSDSPHFALREAVTDVIGKVAALGRTAHKACVRGLGHAAVLPDRAAHEFDLKGAAYGVVAYRPEIAG